MLFVKQYLRKYSRSEVETLFIGRVWWEVDARSIFYWGCFNEISEFVRCSMYEYDHN